MSDKLKECHLDATRDYHADDEQKMIEAGKRTAGKRNAMVWNQLIGQSKNYGTFPHMEATSTQHLP